MMPDKFYARFMPAALSIGPVMPVMLCWWLEPSISHTTWVSIGFAVVAYVFLAQLGYRRAHILEPILNKRWGGSRAIVLLKHHDSTIPQQQKRRYRAALQNLMPGWISPSAEQEVSNPQAASAIYNAAVHWILDQTTDITHFPLLARQSARYRFYLSMLAMRPWLIALSITAVMLGMIKMWLYGYSALEVYATVLSALLAFVIPVFTSREIDVRNAATDYSVSLLETLEILGHGKAS